MSKKSLIIDNKSIPVYSYNTIIIGSGAAALNAALFLHNFGQKDIAIITEKCGGGTSNNSGSDKQTYYKLSLSGNKSDSPVEMAQDLFNGGCMHGDIALCEAQHSAMAFYNLVQLGVPFPHDRYGGFVGYKTDHEKKGRASSAGPLTSHMMFEKLAGEIKRKKIKIFDGYSVISLLTKKLKNESAVSGVVSLNKKELSGENYGLVIFNSINVILGTGGPAGIYKNTVYHESQTGSTGLALEAGAVSHNLTEWQYGLGSIKFRWNLSGSYQQVIPVYYSTDKNGGNKKEFLSDFFPDTASMLNAIFLKGYQWPFDPRKISNYGSSLIDFLVYREIEINKRRVFLDYRSNPSCKNKSDTFSLNMLDTEAYNYLKKSNATGSIPIERLKNLNQPAIDLYMNNGIDISREPLEIAVCAQHNNGGLRANIWWESNLKHLFPVGEVNGTHGVYRPGGSALNAGQVGGIRSAMYISRNYSDATIDNGKFIADNKSQILELYGRAKRMINPLKSKMSPDPRIELQQRMSEQGAFIRDPQNIDQAVIEAWDLWNRLNVNLSVKSANELIGAFKTRDLCLTHAIYLEAMAEYVRKGGKSRGSYLVIDKSGIPINGNIKENWNLSKKNKASFAEMNILELFIDEKLRLHKSWVNPRPVPKKESWFEDIWKEFRENNVIK